MQTRRERLKSALYLRLKKRSFKNMPRPFQMKTRKKASKQPKNASHARKTLQAFGYSVLSHVGAFFEPRPSV